MSPKADLDVLEVLKVKKVEPPHNQKLLALVSTLCLFAWPVYTENARDNTCTCGYTVSISYSLMDYGLSV